MDGQRGIRSNRSPFPRLLFFPFLPPPSRFSVLLSASFAFDRERDARCEAPPPPAPAPPAAARATDRPPRNEGSLKRRDVQLRSRVLRVSVDSSSRVSRRTREIKEQADERGKNGEGGKKGKNAPSQRARRHIELGIAGKRGRGGRGGRRARRMHRGDNFVGVVRGCRSPRPPPTLQHPGGSGNSPP